MMLDEMMKDSPNGKTNGNKAAQFTAYWRKRPYIKALREYNIRDAMSKYRVINTKFWSDGWITELDPIEKLLFLYLLTNEKTDICGLYELPLKIMSIETGIEKEMIEKILNRFKVDTRVVYQNGWVGIKNFIKHQSTTSEKVIIGINTGLSKAPRDLIHTLSIPYPYPVGYSNSNSNIYSNSNNKKKRKNNRFAPPSLEELKNYCEERQNDVNPQNFVDFYSSKGWMIGKNKMKDWKAAIRTWEGRNKVLSVNPPVFHAGKLHGTS